MAGTQDAVGAGATDGGADVGSVVNDGALDGGAATGAAAEGGVTDKTPRTARGRRTLRALLDAAALEFGERGFHDASISAITRRAGVALGSFYTYFDSKDAVFRALVTDLSAQVRDHVAPALRAAGDGLAAERAGLAQFIGFVREHKEIYRIIDESEFVDAASFRAHYASTAERIEQRLRAAAARGEVRDDVGDVHAWAIMGMNVFLGLRFGVWTEDRSVDAVADLAAGLLREGLSPHRRGQGGGSPAGGASVGGAQAYGKQGDGAPVDGAQRDETPVDGAQAGGAQGDGA